MAENEDDHDDDEHCGHGAVAPGAGPQPPTRVVSDRTVTTRSAVAAASVVAGAAVSVVGDRGPAAATQCHGTKGVCAASVFLHHDRTRGAGRGLTQQSVESGVHGHQDGERHQGHEHQVRDHDVVADVAEKSGYGQQE